MSLEYSPTSHHWISLILWDTSLFFLAQRRCSLVCRLNLCGLFINVISASLLLPRVYRYHLIPYFILGRRRHRSHFSFMSYRRKKRVCGRPPGRSVWTHFATADVFLARSASFFDVVTCLLSPSLFWPVLRSFLEGFTARKSGSFFTLFIMGFRSRSLPIRKSILACVSGNQLKCIQWSIGRQRSRISTSTSNGCVSSPVVVPAAFISRTLVAG
jgi:hypothetical protein